MEYDFFHADDVNIFKMAKDTGICEKDIREACGGSILEDAELMAKIDACHSIDEIKNIYFHQAVKDSREERKALWKWIELCITKEETLAVYAECGRDRKAKMFAIRKIAGFYLKT